MKPNCPACHSSHTQDFFAVTAAVPPHYLNGGQMDHVPVDGSIARVLYGPEYAYPMILNRFMFPPRPSFLSFWNLICLLFGIGSILSALAMALTDWKLIPGALVGAIPGALIGSIPWWRERNWERRWGDRSRYLTRVASCYRCHHAWRP